MYGYSGTRAESYAGEYEIPFVALDKQLVKAKAGDMDGNGARNLKDVVLLRRAIADGKDLSDQMGAADINGDGKINLKDVILLRRAIADGTADQL